MSLEATVATSVPPGWGVAVISSRESLADLEACIAALRAASVGVNVTVDLLVNGNPALAAAIAARLGPTGAGPFVVRAWRLAFGDKAHAWNEYVQRIAPAVSHAFFVDGYVRVKPDALGLLAAGLAGTPGALAATAVPSVGRTAAALRATMLSAGGIHGNLHLLSGEVMARLRAAGVRLPLGLYRVDGTLGAVLCFDLDPARQTWDTRRVFVHPQATWDLPAADTFTLGFWLGQFRRRLRQAQGDLENAAIRDHLAVRRQPPASLPATVTALVGDWHARRGAAARALMLRNPLRAWAWRKLALPRDYRAAESPPEWLNPPA